MQPETRYARSGDLHIAYQVFGAGSVDLVIVPGFISNVEETWDNPSAARCENGGAKFDHGSGGIDPLRAA
ncbi:hypothetical protein BB934_02855 [Microvirga ossetica]|uniref:Uncharacterized protein n=1 Tax=Microvirga ossetica TaxID=1882682 RepID=A0A1B2EBE2_9HYPH|nr:hypothetical protein [Microvirga ossetica]ANY77290.1 hypothetical protein BB934_02855 [Microvirga ossetica]